MKSQPVIKEPFTSIYGETLAPGDKVFILAQSGDRTKLKVGLLMGYRVVKRYYGKQDGQIIPVVNVFCSVKRWNKENRVHGERENGSYIKNIDLGRVFSQKAFENPEVIQKLVEENYVWR